MKKRFIKTFTLVSLVVAAVIIIAEGLYVGTLYAYSPIYFHYLPQVPEIRHTPEYQTFYGVHWPCSCGAGCACPKERKCRGGY